MKHSDISIGSVYRSATGTYTVTAATSFASFTSVTLESASGHSFTTTVVDHTGPRSYAWSN